MDVYVWVFLGLAESAELKGEPVVLGEDVLVVFTILQQQFFQESGEAAGPLEAPTGE